MNLTLIQTVLWATGFFLNVALLFVLLYKRRFAGAPWFTVFVAAGCLYTIALFFGYRFGSKQTYATIYWVCEFVDLLMQVAVVLEIATTVLQRSGRWVEGARFRLGVMCMSAPLVAILMASLMKPAAENRLEETYARGSVFATVLVFLLFLGVVAASYQLSLGWKNHPIKESYGFVTWVSAGFATDTLHSYWRTLGHFVVLENVHNVIFQLVTIYWVIVFWLPEQAPLPATDQEKLSLDALKSRLEYGQR